MPGISVILPTYNRIQRLKQVLAGLEAQHYPRTDFEVIVISDGSTDGTHAYLHALSTPLNLTVVAQQNRGPAAARNNGLQHATGDVIVFIDDDVVPTPQLLTEHLCYHADQPDIVVLGPMLTPADFAMLPWVRWEQAMLIKQYNDMAAGRWQPTARQFYTGNTSLARQHLLAVGGFDEQFRRAEDVELAYRLAQRGLRFVFNPDAIGYHYAERSFRSWLETPYAYGRNDVIFMRDKQQRWLRGAIPSEFRDRNLLIQVLVRACLDRKTLSQVMMAWLKRVSDLGQRMQMEQLVRAAYSGIFNVRYYQGVADELGGRERFLASVR